MKKIHRFFYDFRIINNTISIVDSEIINQIKNVLKLKINEKIVVFYNNKEVICSIFSINKKCIICSVLEIVEGNADNDDIVLYCAILKKDNFELVVQKASEVGVSKIVPIITDRTIKSNLNIERLNKIAMEACEQAERKNIVSVEEIKKFRNCLDLKESLNFLFDFSGVEFSDLKIDKNNKKINLFIGPEGGFTDDEVGFARDHDFIIARLGKNVLRGETAAIISSYLLINQL